MSPKEKSGGKLSHAHMGQARSSFSLISASPGQSFSTRSSLQLDLIEKVVFANEFVGFYWPWKFLL